MVINDSGIKGTCSAADHLPDSPRLDFTTQPSRTTPPSAISPGPSSSQSPSLTFPATMTSPTDPHSKSYSHVNGSVSELLDRLAVTELCKGWPVYRDASEWKNYRSLFTDDATVWTTWSGPRHVDDFISISKAGKEQGVFIMHRECGTLAELSAEHGRAVGKMKATITHRFTVSPSDGKRDGSEGSQFDVDCDCRFIFFCEKVPQGDGSTSVWKARYVKLFYEKDKVVPADGYTAPRFTSDELAPYPEGYRYLGAAQARLGYEIDLRLPTARDLDLWDRMYGEIEKWLDGKAVDLFWEGK